MGNVCNNMAGTTYSITRRGGRGESDRGEPNIYPSKDAAIKDLVEKLDKYPTTKDKAYNPAINYTSDYNSWIMSTSYTKTTEQKVHATSDEGVTFYWITRRNTEWAYCGGTIKLHAFGQSSILKDTQNRTSWQIFKKLRDLQRGDVRTQGDDGQTVSQESIQGQPDQTSDKQGSTIITADTTTEESQPSAIKSTSEFSSSEPTTAYPYLTKRWMPYKTFTFDTSQATGYEIMTMWLPEMVYKEASCAPNNIPFETFVYGKMEMEIKVVLNGNKFQVGKLVVSPKFDTYQADSCSDGYQGCLTRNHVILDVPARNEGLLTVPFIYHRAMLRLVKTAQTTAGVRAGKYATVSIKVLSPLVVGTGNQNSCLGQVFYRFRQSEFTGLSYRVTLQGDNMGDSLAKELIPVKTLKSFVSGAERVLEQLGASSNQDKPTGVEATIIIPQPRRFFTATGGVADCVPLRANPLALTTFQYTPTPPGEPQTTLDVARIWGLWKDFKWSKSDEQPKVLLDTVIDPTIRFPDKDYIGAPTPLEYICGMYQFWSGTIELRFDFVSNSFHTGAVLISVEFNRPLQTDTVCAAASTYTTTFHLGEQRSVSIVVPYIYDTIFRRNNGVLINDNFNNTTSTNLKSRSYSVASLSQTRVRVVVLNSLRLPETVTQEIVVLVFMRAGKDFALMSLKPTSFVDYMADKEINSFPRDYTGVMFTERIMAQMDNGDDDKDTTATHAVGKCAQVAQNSDGNISMCAILRRPICIVDNVKITRVSDEVAGFFIPLQPPSRSFVPTNVESSVFTPSAAHTAHAAILNLWRHWRGSMRYTVLVTSPTTLGTLAITHLPHSGTRLRGEQQMGVRSSKISPYKMGFATELLVPTVNMSAHVEVPYETENDWTLMFEEDANRHYTWRDKGDTNAGHLVLQALCSDMNVSVWWAAGDDFALANWYGIPWTKSNDVQYRLDDNVTTVAAYTDATIATTSYSTNEVKTWATERREREAYKVPVQPLASTSRVQPTPPAPTPNSQGPFEVDLSPEAVEMIRHEVTEQQKKNKGKKDKKRGRHQEPGTTEIPHTQGWLGDIASYFTSSTAEEQDPVTGWTPTERQQILDAMPHGVREEFLLLEEEQDTHRLNQYVLQYVYKVPLERVRVSEVETGAEPDQAEEQSQDFQSKDVFTRVTDVIRNSPITPMVLGSIPVIGGGLVAAHVSQKVNKFMDETNANITAAVSAMATTTGDISEACQGVASATEHLGEACKGVSKVTESVVQLTPNIAEMTTSLTTLAGKLNTKVDVISTMLTEACTKITSMFGAVASVSGSIFSFLLDLLVAWIDQSWTAVGVGIVRIIANGMGGNLFATIASYATELGSTLAEFFSRRTGVVLQAEPEDSTAIAIVTILSGIIGTMVGVAVRPTSHSFLREVLLRMTQTSGISYFVQIMNFVKATFKTVKNMVYSTLGMVNPEVQALQALSGQSETIKLFIQNAQTITSDANTALLYVPEYRIKFWQTVLQAQRIQQLMITVPNSCVSPVLSRLCSDVIKVGNEKFLDLAACPVRYEPYVICITGPSGAGKSHMTNKLLGKMLDRIGYQAPASGLAYYRTPLSQYWSGYRDQPVVVFDEWMHMNDANACALQLAELYQLKSTAPFIPNMAHLEEKRIRGNPLIVVLLCNNAFPQLDQVHCKQAVWRRREDVFRVMVKDEFRDINPRDMTPEQQATYAHLDFVHYTDPCDAESDNTEPLGFEAFVDYTCNKFARYHQQERRNVAQQMDQLNALNRNVPADAYNIRDPFSVFYGGATSIPIEVGPQWVPTERLQADIANMAAALDHLQQQHVEEAPLEVPVWGTGMEFPRHDPNEFEEGMPEVQMEPVTAAALGCLATQIPLVLSYAWVGAKNLLRTAMSGVENLQVRNGVRGTCSVCYGEDLEITHLCQPAWERYQVNHEIVHATCGACYARMRALGTHACSVCRGPMRPVVTRDELTWWMRTLRMIHLALENGVEITHICSQLSFMLNDWNRWWFFYTILFDVLTIGATVLAGDPLVALTPWLFVVGTITVVHVADSYYRDVPLWPSFVYVVNETEGVIRGDVDQFARPPGTEPLNYFRQVTTQEEYYVLQADDGEPVLYQVPIEDHRDAPPLVENLTPPRARTITYELIQRRVRRECPDTGPCLHHLLIENIQNVTYCEGWWYISHNNQRVKVWDGVCQTELCYWKPQPTTRYTHVGLAAQRFFYRYFLQERQQQLAHHYTTWVNATGAQRDYILNKIPYVFRPAWMQDPVELDEPIQNATSASWWQWLCDAYAQYRTIIQVITIAAAASGAMYAVWVAGSHYGLWGAGGAAVGAALPNLAQADVYDLRTQHVTRTRASRRTRAAYFAQTQGEATVSEVAGRYIQNNTILIKLLDSKGQCARLFHAIGLFNHTALLPGHYVDPICEWPGTIMLENMQRPYLTQVYKPTHLDFHQSTVNDIALWTAPSSINSFKDIRKFVAKDEDLDKPFSAKGTLYVVPTRHLPNMVLVEVDLAGIVNNMAAKDPSGSTVTIQDALEYNFSKAGACGSILLLERTQRPIVSMHVAGSGEGLQGVGYGLILTQEALGDMVGYDTSVPETVATQGEEHMKLVWPPNVQLDYHGSVTEAETPWIPNKSKLRKSDVHGTPGLTVDIEPAILSSHDPRYVHEDTPLVAGCEKHGQLTENFPSTWLRGPKQHLRSMLMTMRPLVVNAKVLTESEAIAGFDLPYYDPIDVNTSAGYPLTLRGKTQKKEWMELQRDSQERIVSGSLIGEAKEIFEEASRVRKSGKRYPTLFTDTLKDEKRPHAKVMKRGGTRVFCNGPLEHMLHMRRYFTHFSAAFMMNRRKLMHAVGINPTGAEWDQLAKDLIAKGKKICTLDYANFGPGFNACVAKIALELIAEWTAENVAECDETEMWMLLVECMNSVHIASNTVYSQTSGSPSGAVLTTVINSLVNMIYILVAWEQLVGPLAKRNGKLAIYEEFKQHTHLCVYGDDLVMSVSDTYIETFNTLTITQFFGQFGITATDASKTEKVTPYTTLLEAEFLKRKWVRHPHRKVWMSQLRMDTILSTTQWVWESGNRKESTRVNCEVACMMAHGHGPTKFEELLTRVNGALVKKKIDPISITWDEVDQGIYDYGVAQFFW